METNTVHDESNVLRAKPAEVTTYFYDADKLVAEIAPAGRIITYRYDVNATLMETAERASSTDSPC